MDTQGQRKGVEYCPLVTINVNTYNSSKYVLETLESAKAQTYDKIELIIADDCSTDHTVELCKSWLRENRERFVRTELITSKCNTGIPENLNRGLKASQGEWIKNIAGDDLLLPNCVSQLLAETSAEKDIIVGIMQNFSVQNGVKIYGETVPVKKRYFLYEGDAAFQHKYLLTKSFNFNPGALIRRRLYVDMGFYDERWRLLEDLPFWLKATDLGKKIYISDNKKPCVLFRTHHESCSYTNVGFYNTGFYDCMYKFHQEVIYKEIPYSNILFYESEFMHKLAYLMIKKMFQNKRNGYTVTFSKCLEYLSLSHYIYPIVNSCYRKKFGKCVHLK